MTRSMSSSRRRSTQDRLADELADIESKRLEAVNEAEAHVAALGRRTRRRAAGRAPAAAGPARREDQCDPGGARPGYRRRRGRPGQGTAGADDGRSTTLEMRGAEGSARRRMRRRPSSRRIVDDPDSVGPGLSAAVRGTFNPAALQGFAARDRAAERTGRCGREDRGAHARARPRCEAKQADLHLRDRVMAITVEERYDSPSITEGADPAAELSFLIHGTADEALALQELQTQAPGSYLGTATAQRHRRAHGAPGLARTRLVRTQGHAPAAADGRVDLRLRYDGADSSTSPTRSARSAVMQRPATSRLTSRAPSASRTRASRASTSPSPSTAGRRRTTSRTARSPRRTRASSSGSRARSTTTSSRASRPASASSWAPAARSAAPTTGRSRSASRAAPTSATSRSARSSASARRAGSTSGCAMSPTSTTPPTASSRSRPRSTASRSTGRATSHCSGSEEVEASGEVCSGRRSLQARPGR
jgi:hypothetical protein